MITFNFYELIVALGLVQGAFLAFVLRKIKNQNAAANRILSYTLILAAIMLTGRIIYAVYPSLLTSQWSLLPDAVIFLFGPLIYLYTLRLLFSGRKTKLSYIHFIPATVQIGIFLYLLTYSRNEYQQLLFGGDLVPLFATISGIAITLNFFYGIQSFRLLHAYKSEEKQQLSFVQNTVDYLRYFLVAVFLVLVVWLVNFLNRLLLQIDIPYINYDSVWIALSLFVYMVAFYSLRQPELFRIPITQAGDEKTTDRIPLTRQEYLKKALKELMENKKLHLNHNLTLSMLADELDESTNNISWILNNVFQKKFYDFVNQYRIREFIRKIENNEHHQKTLLGLSQEVGFNSKSTFNRAFKLEMNCTPSSYVKNTGQTEEKQTSTG